MKIKRIKFLLSLGASCAAALVAAPTFGQTVVVDDNFAADGTATTDAQYFYSSSNNGIEFNADSLGLVSGSSGRQIHGIFPAVTLTEIGDSITVSFTFVTPATVGTNDAGSGEDNAFRMGLFNTLGRETPVLIDNPDFDPTDPNSPAEIQEVIDGVPQTEGFLGNTLASSNPDTGPGPNDLYGNTTAGIIGLPGFSMSYDSMDINGGFPDDEAQIRQSITASGSGRMMTTTTGFQALESLDSTILASPPGLLGEGPFSEFEPNTTYTGTFTITRTTETEVDVMATMSLPGFPEPIITTPGPTVDAPAGEEFTFDYVGFAGSSGSFGSSNTPGDPDNGIDFTSIQIETTGDVDLPATTVGDFDGDGDVDCDDLDGYVGNLGNAAAGALAALDIDSSGFLEAADATAHITTLVQTSNGVVGTFPGDVNCDGQVNVLGDAFALGASLGGPATMYSQGDLNFDGQVNVLGDAFVLVANLGSSNSNQ